MKRVYDRDKKISEVLEKLGRPASYSEIFYHFPDEYKMATMSSTHSTCERMVRDGRLKSWGGGSHFKVYGLPHHEEPAQLVRRRPRRTRRGLY